MKRDIKNINIITKDLKNDYSNEVLQIEIWNGEKTTIEISPDTLDLALDSLKDYNFKTELMECLIRFSKDSEEHEDSLEVEYFKNEWERLLYMISNNYPLKKFDDEDIRKINNAFRICNIFKDFDFETWVVHEKEQFVINRDLTHKMCLASATAKSDVKIAYVECPEFLKRKKK